jgi:hypothetical protein
VAQARQDLRGLDRRPVRGAAQPEDVPAGAPRRASVRQLERRLERHRRLHVILEHGRRRVRQGRPVRGLIERRHGRHIEGGRPGESTTTTTIRDDEGSSSSITSPHLGGGKTRRTGKTRADRSGTYSLDGYTLELRYDSGLVERHLFFASPDRRDILFRGSLMWRKKT